MGERYVFRGSGNSGDKRTSDNLKANRTVNRQALETGWEEDKKNVKGCFFENVDAPCFVYLSRSSLAAVRVGSILSFTVFSR